MVITYLTKPLCYLATILIAARNNVESLFIVATYGYHMLDDLPIMNNVSYCVANNNSVFILAWVTISITYMCGIEQSAVVFHK